MHTSSAKAQESEQNGKRLPLRDVGRRGDSMTAINTRMRSFKQNPKPFKKKLLLFGSGCCSLGRWGLLFKDCWVIDVHIRTTLSTRLKRTMLGYLGSN